jgi:predicted Zn-dependent peptidase
MSTNLVWKRTILPNGLIVLTYPRLSANTAQLSITVKSGSNQEPKEAAGVTHFLEHMLAGGSQKRIQLSRSIEDSGGVLDFYTDHEQVTSTLDVLPEKLPEATSVLCNLLFDACFDVEKFEVERKIILNELAEFADDPSVRVEELLLETLFKKHPVRRPVGGYPKTVKALSMEHLKDEHKNNYNPKNMVLSLAGKFSEKTLQAVLKEAGGVDCADKPENAVQKPETTKPKNRVEAKKAGITQSYLYVGARTVPSNHKDTPALDLIATMLGGGTTSRLFEQLREKHGITYDVGAAHCKGSDFGYLGINCAVVNKKIDKATKLVAEELRKLQATPVSDEELERTKQVMLGSVLRGMDNPHDTLEIINFMELQFQTQNALADYVQKIRSVTNQDILDAANRHLAEDRVCTALLFPAESHRRC